jgi:hypothetical protein
MLWGGGVHSDCDLRTDSHVHRTPMIFTEIGYKIPHGRTRKALQIQIYRSAAVPHPTFIYNNKNRLWV